MKTYRVTSVRSVQAGVAHRVNLIRLGFSLIDPELLDWLPGDADCLAESAGKQFADG